MLLQQVLHPALPYVRRRRRATTAPPELAHCPCTSVPCALIRQQPPSCLLQEEAGYRCSAGIACNKLLAKLASGLHKPDDQTVLPPPEAAGFVAPLPPRALAGVGGSRARLAKCCSYFWAEKRVGGRSNWLVPLGIAGAVWRRAELAVP